MSLPKEIKTLIKSFHNDQFEKRQQVNAIVLLQFEVWKMAGQPPVYLWSPGRKQMLINRYVSPRFFEALRNVEAQCIGQDATKMLKKLREGGS